jgi:hypothetical protein
MAEIADNLRCPQPNYRRIRQLAYELGDEMGNISNTEACIKKVQYTLIFSSI